MLNSRKNYDPISFPGHCASFLYVIPSEEEQQSSHLFCPSCHLIHVATADCFFSKNKINRGSKQQNISIITLVLIHPYSMSSDNLEDLVQQLKELRLAEEQVIERIDRIVASTVPSTRQRVTAIRTSAGPAVFIVGQRVRIKNKVTVIGRPSQAGDNVGTILKITEKRVKVFTDTGLIITRAPTNLQYPH